MEDTMRSTTLFRGSLAAAIGMLLIGAGAPLAQESKRAEVGPIAASPAWRDWTVVTMAWDGSLGVATSPSAGEAIAQAIRNCKTMSREGIGCGAQSKAARAGWILAVRCGTTNLMAGEASLKDAQRAIADRIAKRS
jgi:hypothetical protein